MFDALTPIIFAGITFPIVLVMQRWVHRHLQGVALLMTGQVTWSVVLYAIILFPGVLLHELSHWVTATLLGVRTAGFSVIPRKKGNESIQLGYVSYESRDVGAFRESLIGAAPLFFGTTAVLLIGFYVYGVSDLAPAIQTGNIDDLANVFGQIFATNDFFVWLYLIFAISNAMMPSASDRRAWPLFFAVVSALTILLLFLGFQDLLWQGVAGPVATVFGYLGTAFSMTIGVNLVFMGLIYIVEMTLGRLRGMHVAYGDRPRSVE